MLRCQELGEAQNLFLIRVAQVRRRPMQRTAGRHVGALLTKEPGDIALVEASKPTQF
jgi:hypothetical protein